ncbi:phytanoyl-CoA dioxygenase family protein [Ilumatobacter sp.]|uniref:phytanoyl-CoA dioxygenase family protein n=1 Tax=Ilumatobacter sp. TaxID=1967498 RepID=UPI0037512287
MTALDHRLTTRQMAEFVANGFLRFDAIVPRDINQRAIAELEALNAGRLLPSDDLDAMRPPHSGTPLDDCYPEPSVIGEYLRLPQIRGIIESLVGRSPEFDHDWVHYIPSGGTFNQPLHVDANVDSLDQTFDIQMFWFCDDVAPGEGGTRFVPGSHLARVRSSGLHRYQHIVGEQQVACAAGSVFVFHHGLWHAGQPNPGSDRWMHKIRLNPTEPQVRLWNTDDFDGLQSPPTDHFFARMQSGGIAEILRSMPPWMGVTEYRNTQIQRSLLWRYLSGDDSFDVDYYLTRMEQRSKRAAGSVAR